MCQIQPCFLTGVFLSESFWGLFCVQVSSQDPNNIYLVLLLCMI